MGSRMEIGDEFSNGTETGSLDNSSELLYSGISTNSTSICTPVDTLSFAQHK